VKRDRKGWMSKKRSGRSWQREGNEEGVGNRERAERTSTYVIRFAPLRRNCLNSPVGLSASYTLAYRKPVDTNGNKMSATRK